MKTIYDLVILEAGPAGLAVGFYGDRHRSNALLVERGQDGGQIAITLDTENYPGQMMGVEESGVILIAHVTKQMDEFGIHRVSVSIRKVELEGPVKRPTDTKGSVYRGKTMTIATGARPRPIGYKSKKEFLDRGISSCATCDANFYEDMEVYVMGGEDSAIEEAIYFIKSTRKITMIHRRDRLRAAQSAQGKAFRNEKLHFMWDSVMDEVRDDGILNAMVVRNVKTGELTQVNADSDNDMFGLFGLIEYLPSTGLFEDTGLVMENGYIRTDEDIRTNLSGVYAAGDVRAKSLHQVATAAVDGTAAAYQAEHYVADL